MRIYMVAVNLYMAKSQHALALGWRSVQKWYLNSLVRIQGAYYRVVGIGFEGGALSCHLSPC